MTTCPPCGRLRYTRRKNKRTSRLHTCSDDPARQRRHATIVGEGTGNVARLLEAERKRTARVLPTVPVTVIVAGRGEGQVPLPKLPAAVRKLKPKLTKPEVAEVTKRLQALGGARLPVPKGVDPLRMRPDRKGMRGR